MKRFTFDFKKYNFWAIYETVKRFYPVGIEWDEMDFNSIHYQYPGFLEREKIIHVNLFVTKNYNERWGKFRKYLKNELRKPVEGSIFASEPSFVGNVVLEKYKGKDFERSKELHFAISLLGPFYTIYGLDRSTITLEGEKLPMGYEHDTRPNYFTSNHVVTVSPILEYEKSFSLLKEKISNYFPSYKFVPYEINIMRIEGLNTSYSLPKENLSNSIHGALFNNFVDLDIPTRGDLRYGYDEWILEKETTQEEIENLQTLNNNINNVSSRGREEITLNKVWRYKSSKRISKGGAFFGMETPEILDFTSKEFVLITTKESQTPGKTKYQVIDDKIILENSKESMFFNISYMTADELRLILSSIPPEERDKRVELTESLCVVDEEHFFHRGRMIIPIKDYKEDLIWNVWTSISKENFINRNDSWNNPDRVKEGPYFGWLQTTIPTYLETLNIKTMAYEQEVGYFPEIKSIEENHPLTIDQEKGITLEKALSIVDVILREQHGKE